MPAETPTTDLQPKTQQPEQQVIDWLTFWKEQQGNVNTSKPAQQLKDYLASFKLDENQKPVAATPQLGN